MRDIRRRIQFFQTFLSSYFQILLISDTHCRTPEEADLWTRELVAFRCQGLFAAENPTAIIWKDSAGIGPPLTVNSFTRFFPPPHRTTDMVISLNDVPTHLMAVYAPLCYDQVDTIHYRQHIWGGTPSTPPSPLRRFPGFAGPMPPGSSGIGHAWGYEFYAGQCGRAAIGSHLLNWAFASLSVRGRRPRWHALGGALDALSGFGGHHARAFTPARLDHLQTRASHPCDPVGEEYIRGELQAFVPQTSTESGQWVELKQVLISAGRQASHLAARMARLDPHFSLVPSKELHVRLFSGLYSEDSVSLSLRLRGVQQQAVLPPFGGPRSRP
ncbi:hypothetical protein V1509DRAFT_634329 [Lipomyces kononenkoae]